MKWFSLAAAFLGAASAVYFDEYRPPGCAQLDHSSVEEPSPNTPESFADFPWYGETAENVKDLGHYRTIIKNQNATIESPLLIKYYKLDEYDVLKCARYCDYSKFCGSFNIFFQRNPAILPADECPNPNAHTLVVCGIYMGHAYPSQLLDEGLFIYPRDDNGTAFEIIIRGSNRKKTF